MRLRTASAAEVSRRALGMLTVHGNSIAGG